MSAGELPSLSPTCGLGDHVVGDSTPTLNPLGVLMVGLDPGVVLILFQFLRLYLGAVGAFRLLQRWTGDSDLSLLGAMMFLGIPFIYGMQYYSATASPFFCLPWLLLLANDILERRGTCSWVAFTATSLLTVSISDIYVFFIVVPAIFSYGLVTGLRLGLRPAVLVGQLTLMLSLFLMSGTFYLIPLAGNLLDISVTNSVLHQLGIATASSAFGLGEFCAFVARQGGLHTLIVPIEGSALFLYVPIGLWLAITAAFIYKRTDTQRSLCWISWALLWSGLAMVLVSLVFYTIPCLASMGKGVLRVHWNLIPFAVALAGFVSLAVIKRLPELERCRLFLGIAVVSLTVEFLIILLPWTSPDSLFYIRHAPLPNSVAPNFIPVRILNDMWLLLPVTNLLCLALVYFTPTHEGQVNDKIMLQSFGLRSTLLAISGAIMLLFAVSLHGELRASQQSAWQQSGSNASAHQDFLNRAKALSAQVPWNDPFYRTVPCSAPVLSQTRGRNWKLIAETEMQGSRKTLFQYRETMHPYVAMLYSALAFSGRSYSPSNWFPPLAEQLEGKADFLRLLGVRWVLCADGELHGTDYRLAATYHSDPSLARLAEQWPDMGGIINVYELVRPKGIAFMGSRYRVMTRSEAIKGIYWDAARPWENGEVWLEENMPSASFSGAPRPSATPLKDKVQLVRETPHSMQFNTSAATNGMLVLSCLYRAGWDASLDGKRVPVLRAYGGLMAVPMPAGQHEVTFRYRPRDLWLGLGITAFSIVSAWIIDRRQVSSITVRT